MIILQYFLTFVFSSGYNSTSMMHFSFFNDNSTKIIPYYNLLRLQLYKYEHFSFFVMIILLNFSLLKPDLVTTIQVWCTFLFVMIILLNLFPVEISSGYNHTSMMHFSFCNNYSTKLIPCWNQLWLQLYKYEHFSFL